MHWGDLDDSVKLFYIVAAYPNSSFENEFNAFAMSV
jgi:hypothetical protein